MITYYEWMLTAIAFWLIVLTLLFIVAMKKPSARIGMGIAILVLGIFLLFLPAIGLLGIAPLVAGVFLLVWGLADKLEKRETRKALRICPRCGRDLSRFPNDIRRCPYCGNDLV